MSVIYVLAVHGRRSFMSPESRKRRRSKRSIGGGEMSIFDRLEGN